MGPRVSIEVIVPHEPTDGGIRLDDAEAAFSAIGMNAVQGVSVLLAALDLIFRDLALGALEELHPDASRDLLEDMSTSEARAELIRLAATLPSEVGMRVDRTTS